MKQKTTTMRLMVLSAMFAAMIALLTFTFKIPTAGGYVHLGDTMIYLAAVVLPTPYAMAAAAVGGGLADMFGGYFHYIIPTMIIKALLTLAFSANREKMFTLRNALVTIPNVFITVAGYYLTKVCLLAADKLTTSAGFLGAFTDATVWLSALSNIPENILQAVCSGLAFIVLALALDRIRFKERVVNLRAS